LSSQIRGLDWKSIGQPGRTISRDLEVFYPENRFLNFYLAPIDDAEGSGETLGYVMLVRDLTRTPRRGRGNLESERLNALTLLAAGVAHEIGNPLNSLDIHLQLLGRKLRKLPPGERSRSKTTWRPRAARSSGSTRSSSSSSTPCARPRRAASAATSTLLHETLRLLEPELESRKIEVELDLAHSLPPANVDAGQFQQVFYNLLRNAYQALPGEDGRIVIRTRFNDYEMSFPSRTTAPASRRSTWARFSSPTARPSPPAPASACSSCAGSSASTAARSPSRARKTAAPASSSTCRAPSERSAC
jgi:two-component system, sporulation sensor kinase E